MDVNTRTILLTSLMTFATREPREGKQKNIMEDNLKIRQRGNGEWVANHRTIIAPRSQRPVARGGAARGRQMKLRSLPQTAIPHAHPSTQKS